MDQGQEGVEPEWWGDRGKRSLGEGKLSPAPELERFGGEGVGGSLEVLAGAHRCSVSQVSVGPDNVLKWA